MTINPLSRLFLSSLMTALMVIFLALLRVGPTAAQSPPGASPWADKGESRVRIIAPKITAGEGDSVSLGLEFLMEPGWKAYWRSPGDAGLPPQVDWSGSTNLAAAEIFWPAPRRYLDHGLETVGYEKEVVLPVTARLETPGLALSLNARVDYLVCKEICIPRQANLTFELLTGGGDEPSPFAVRIARYAALVPDSQEGGELAVERVEALGTGENGRLRITARSDRPFGDVDVFVEGPPGFWAGAPKVRKLAGDRVVVLILVAGVTPSPGDDRKNLSLVGMPLIVTLVERDVNGDASPSRMLETRLTVGAGTETDDLGELLGILAIALLGGFILNLMPCVLPVLSLKLLGIIDHGGGEVIAVRRSFLATSAGILFAFMMLASLAVGLRIMGVSVGWGIQFQQPVFLATMAVVLTLFACNLWGFFEIPLPGWMGDLTIRHGGHLQGRPHSLEGQFLTGAFATLLATPCSAPFLGTAIGFAMVRSVAETYIIFFALGLGFASPYLTMVVAPKLAVYLPHPGQWMVSLRRLLGLALAFTALWLVSVLAAQLSVAAAALVAALLLAMGAVLWIQAEGKLWSSLPPSLMRLAVGVLVLTVLVAPGRFEEAPPLPSPDDIWRPFDHATIAPLVQSGHVVLVDVTAGWCLTCQVNKKLVLDRTEVAQMLASDSVTAMRADWTRRDDNIAAYLAGFGRFGIPFNAVYGPATPRGIVLPELLTPAQVIDAVNRAGKRISSTMD